MEQVRVIPLQTLFPALAFWPIKLQDLGHMTCGQRIRLQAKWVLQQTLSHVFGSAANPFPPLGFCSQTSCTYLVLHPDIKFIPLFQISRTCLQPHVPCPNILSQSETDKHYQFSDAPMPVYLLFVFSAFSSLEKRLCCVI